MNLRKILTSILLILVGTASAEVTSGFSLGANKAYLDTPVATSARGFVFDVDNSTGISMMDDVRCKTDNIYDLSGRHVDSMKHGIYIINGKKIIK